MILLIIRHGESEADLLDVHEGRADFELTERGHLQAEAMASFVKNNYTVNQIYASTLKRAAQTAQYLSDSIDITIEFEEDLMEFNNGLLAGLSRKEADEKYPKIVDLPVDKAVYGQESKLEFRNRANKVLQKIVNNSNDDDVIAVVTHGGMINQLYRSMLNLPIEIDIFFGTGDTGIHVWKLQDGTKTVVKANMTEHTKGI